MAGEQMTLLDYAASQKANYLLQGFVNAMMDDDSPGGGMALLDVLPVVPVEALNGVVYRLTTEGSPLPTSRPIGGAYNTGVVTLSQEQTNVGIFGQDVPIDLAYLKKQGNYIQGATPQELQTKELSRRMNRLINNQLFNGAKASDPNSMNGIRYFCDSLQVINPNTDLPNGASYNNGLNVWSSWTTTKGQDYITALDYLIDCVGTQNAVLLMNNQAQRAMEKSLRDTPGLLKTTSDSYDREYTTYKGVRIVNPGSKNPVLRLKDAINNTNAILPNNFSFGSANNATEIYCIRTGAGEGCVLLEYSPLNVRTVATEVSQGPQMLIRADWYPGFYRFKESAIAKLTGVIAV